MRNDSRHILWSILLAVVLSFCGFSAGAGGSFSNVAMLQFSDYTDNPEATAAVIPALERAFSDIDPSILLPENLRPVLRAHRIRAVGMIDRQGAEAIASETGAKYLLTGSVDFYEDGDYPAVGFSIRVIKISDTRPIYAASISATGDRFIGMFGLGRVSDVDSLAFRLAYRAAEDVRTFLETFSGGVGAASPSVAIVPFDAVETDGWIGGAASDYILTRLIRDGINVIEPGVCRGLFLRMGQSPRGEVGYELIDALRDSLGVDLIITGAVDGFTAQPIGEGRSQAEISIGARLLNANTRQIVASEYIIKRSESGSGLLAGNAQFPAAEAMSAAINNIAERLPILSWQAATD